MLTKLEWFRKGGEVSERRWREVLGILEVQGAQLDRRHVRHWAERLAVLDLLGEALGEAELDWPP